MFQNKRQNNQKPYKQNIDMVFADKYSNILVSFGNTREIKLDVIEGHIPKRRNGYDPHDHAIRTKRPNAIYTLEKEPVHKSDTQNRANFHTCPVPALKFGARHHGHTRSDKHRKRNQS